MLTAILYSLIGMASRVSPSRCVNGPIFLYIYLYVCDGHYRNRNVIISNFTLGGLDPLAKNALHLPSIS